MISFRIKLFFCPIENYILQLSGYSGMIKFLNTDSALIQLNCNRLLGACNFFLNRLRLSSLARFQSTPLKNLIKIFTNVLYLNWLWIIISYTKIFRHFNNLTGWKFLAHGKWLYVSRRELQTLHFKNWLIVLWLNVIFYKLIFGHNIFQVSPVRFFLLRNNNRLLT